MPSPRARLVGSIAVQATALASMWVFLTDNIVSLQMVSGRSMQPALNPDSNRLWRDVVLVERLVRGELAGRLRRGDVVTLASPTDPDRRLVKRIIAMPHDCVVPLGRPDTLVRVPKGHCWIEGDESFHSSDSNAFGPVPLGLVTARVVAPVWPPWRFAAAIPPLPAWKRERVHVNGHPPPRS